MEGKFSKIKYIRQNLKDLGIDPNIISNNKKLKKEINELNHQLSLSKDERKGLSNDYWDISERNKELFNENKQQKELLDKIYQQINEAFAIPKEKLKEPSSADLIKMRIIHYEKVISNIFDLYPKENKHE